MGSVTVPTRPVVADTHILVWYLQAEPRLSDAARVALNDATVAGDPIFISAASVVELRYLFEKGGIDEGDYRSYCLTLEKSGGIFEVAPMDMGVAAAVESVPRDCVPDPFDRMIGATAVALGLPLVTADRKLRRLSALETIW